MCAGYSDTKSQTQIVYIKTLAVGTGNDRAETMVGGARSRVPEEGQDGACPSSPKIALRGEAEAHCATLRGYRYGIDADPVAMSS